MSWLGARSFSKRAPEDEDKLGEEVESTNVPAQYRPNISSGRRWVTLLSFFGSWSTQAPREIPDCGDQSTIKLQVSKEDNACYRQSLRNQLLTISNEVRQKRENRMKELEKSRKHRLRELEETLQSHESSWNKEARKAAPMYEYSGRLPIAIRLANLEEERADALRKKKERDILYGDVKDESSIGSRRNIAPKLKGNHEERIGSKFEGESQTWLWLYSLTGMNGIHGLRCVFLLLGVFQVWRIVIPVTFHPIIPWIFALGRRMQHLKKVVPQSEHNRWGIDAQNLQWMDYIGVRTELAVSLEKARSLRSIAGNVRAELLRVLPFYLLRSRVDKVSRLRFQDLDEAAGSSQHNVPNRGKRILTKEASISSKTDAARERRYPEHYTELPFYRNVLFELGVDSKTRASLNSVEEEQLPASKWKEIAYYCGNSQIVEDSSNMSPVKEGGILTPQGSETFPCSESLTLPHPLPPYMEITKLGFALSEVDERLNESLQHTDLQEHVANHQDYMFAGESNSTISSAPLPTILGEIEAPYYNQSASRGANFASSLPAENDLQISGQDQRENATPSQERNYSAIDYHSSDLSFERSIISRMAHATTIQISCASLGEIDPKEQISLERVGALELRTHKDSEVGIAEDPQKPLTAGQSVGMQSSCLKTNLAGIFPTKSCFPLVLYNDQIVMHHCIESLAEHSFDFEDWLRNAWDSLYESPIHSQIGTPVCSALSLCPIMEILPYGDNVESSMSNFFAWSGYSDDLLKLNTDSTSDGSPISPDMELNIQSKVDMVENGATFGKGLYKRMDAPDTSVEQVTYIFESDCEENFTSQYHAHIWPSGKSQEQIQQAGSGGLHQTRSLSKRLSSPNFQSDSNTVQVSVLRDLFRFKRILPNYSDCEVEDHCLRSHRLTHARVDDRALRRRLGRHNSALRIKRMPIHSGIKRMQIVEISSSAKFWLLQRERRARLLASSSRRRRLLSERLLNSSASQRQEPVILVLSPLVKRASIEALRLSNTATPHGASASKLGKPIPGFGFKQILHSHAPGKSFPLACMPASSHTRRTVLSALIARSKQWSVSRLYLSLLRNMEFQILPFTLSVFVFQKRAKVLLRDMRSFFYTMISNLSVLQSFKSPISQQLTYMFVVSEIARYSEVTPSSNQQNYTRQKICAVKKGFLQKSNSGVERFSRQDSFSRSQLELLFPDCGFPICWSFFRDFNSGSFHNFRIEDCRAVQNGRLSTGGALRENSRCSDRSTESVHEKYDCVGVEQQACKVKSDEFFATKLEMDVISLIVSKISADEMEYYYDFDYTVEELRASAAGRLFLNRLRSEVFLRPDYLWDGRDEDSGDGVQANGQEYRISKVPTIGNPRAETKIFSFFRKNTPLPETDKKGSPRASEVAKLSRKSQSLVPDVPDLFANHQLVTMDKSLMRRAFRKWLHGNLKNYLSRKQLEADSPSELAVLLAKVLLALPGQSTQLEYRPLFLVLWEDGSQRRLG